MSKTVFWLKSQPLGAEFDTVSNALGALDSIETVTSWDEVNEKIASCHQPVVIFSTTQAELSPQLAKLRMCSPAVASIVLMSDGEDLDNSLFGLECDFILPSTSPFEVQLRVHIASKLSELKATVEESAQLDEVTTLYNRRYFMDRLNGEISLAKRHLSPLSLVVIRLSFFQVYIDSYGYDFVLDLFKHIATVVRQQTRQEDLIARIGDDEIALLLPRSTEKGAKNLTERIINKLTTEPYYPFGNKDQEGEEISVYAGIAGYPVVDEDVSDADSLLRYARHAVHQARCSSDGLVLLFSEIEPVL